MAEAVCFNDMNNALHLPLGIHRRSVLHRPPCQSSSLAAPQSFTVTLKESFVILRTGLNTQSNILGSSSQSDGCFRSAKHS